MEPMKATSAALPDVVDCFIDFYEDRNHPQSGTRHRPV